LFDGHGSLTHPNGEVTEGEWVLGVAVREELPTAAPEATPEETPAETPEETTEEG
jgi:hypothetical protein